MIKDDYQGIYVKCMTPTDVIKIPIFPSFTENVSVIMNDELKYLDMSRKISFPEKAENATIYKNCWMNDEDNVFDIAMRIVIHKFVLNDALYATKTKANFLSSIPESDHKHNKDTWSTIYIVYNFPDFNHEFMIGCFYTESLPDKAREILSAFNQNIMNPTNMHTFVMSANQGKQHTNSTDTTYEGFSFTDKDYKSLIAMGSFWQNKKYASVGSLVINLAGEMILYKNDLDWWRKLFDPVFRQMVFMK